VCLAVYRKEKFATEQWWYKTDARITDPPLHQLDQDFVVDRVEGHHDTLPIISTFPNA